MEFRAVLALSFVLTAISLAEGLERQLVDSLHGRVRRAATTDFDEWARKFVEQKAREYNRRVSWWDLYGNHPHLRERPQYHRYKIDVEVSNIQYGKTVRDIERPNVVYTKRWENGLSKEIKVKIAKEIQRENQYSWTVTSGIKLRHDVMVPADKPGLFGSKRQDSNSTTISLESSKRQGHTEVETLRMEYNLVVQPNTCVKAEWVLTEREAEVPWQADVSVEGWIAVWFSEKYDGHWLWFYPIKQLSSPVFKARGSGLVYTATGIFRGVQGIDSDLKTYEFPLQQSGCEHPVKAADIPLPYEPTHVTAM